MRRGEARRNEADKANDYDGSGAVESQRADRALDGVRPCGHGVGSPGGARFQAGPGLRPVPRDGGIPSVVPGTDRSAHDAERSDGSLLGRSPDVRKHDPRHDGPAARVALPPSGAGRQWTAPARGRSRMWWERRCRQPSCGTATFHLVGRGCFLVPGHGTELWPEKGRGQWGSAVRPEGHPGGVRDDLSAADPGHESRGIPPRGRKRAGGDGEPNAPVQLPVGAIRLARRKPPPIDCGPYPFTVVRDPGGGACRTYVWDEQYGAWLAGTPAARYVDGFNARGRHRVSGAPEWPKGPGITRTAADRASKPSVPRHSQ